MNREDEIRLLGLAIELSRNCPPSETAFSVGCVITDEDGNVLARGFSRELGDTWHAEAVAIEKLKKEARQHPDSLILFSSMEPCSVRKSGRRSCCAEIMENPIRRVVFALREPDTFVTCDGIQVLRQRGIEVEQYGDYDSEVRRINGHLLEGHSGA